MIQAVLCMLWSVLFDLRLQVLQHAYGVLQVSRTSILLLKVALL